MKTSLSFYRKLFEESPVGMTIYDSSGQCLNTNKSICKIIGATEEQVLAQNYNHIESWKKSGLLEKVHEAVATNQITHKKFTVTSTFNKELTAIANFLPFTDNGESYILFTLDDLTEYQHIEDKLKKTTHDLGELGKLNCLFEFSKLIEKEKVIVEEILQGTAEIIPPSWQYPDITCAQVKMGNTTYQTDNFTETQWKQSKEIIVSGESIGTIEVYYLEEKPEIHEGPFLKEERDLFNNHP